MPAVSLRTTGRPSKLQLDLDNVAGGAGLVGDNGDIAAGQRIEEARLADIGRAGQHHLEPITHQFAAVVIIEVGGDGLSDRCDLPLGLAERIGGNVRLV